MSGWWNLHSPAPTANTPYSCHLWKHNNHPTQICLPEKSFQIQVCAVVRAVPRPHLERLRADCITLRKWTSWLWPSPTKQRWRPSWWFHFLRACCMQLTANEHEYDWENLLVVRVGGNVAEPHGDETGEAKVEASAVATLVGWVMWDFDPKLFFVKILSDSGGVTWVSISSIVFVKFLSVLCNIYLKLKSGSISNGQKLKLFAKLAGVGFMFGAVRLKWQIFVAWWGSWGNPSKESSFTRV